MSIYNIQFGTQCHMHFESYLPDLVSLFLKISTQKQHSRFHGAVNIHPNDMEVTIGLQNYDGNNIIKHKVITVAFGYIICSRKMAHALLCSVA